MARPIKSGLDYWPRKVGLFRDRKFRRVKMKFGYIACIVYEILLDLIYEDKGYYLKYDDETKDDVVWDICSELQGKYQPDNDTIQEIIAELATCGLFSRDCFNNGLITSKRLQQTYYRATVDRIAIDIDFDIWLLSESEMRDLSNKSIILSNFINRPNNSINCPNNSINHPDNTQSKVNKSKVNKSKVTTTGNKQNSKLENDKPLCVVKTAYLKEYHEIYPTIESEIKAYLEQGMTDQLICLAINIAASNGKAWNYAKGILRTWNSKNIKTVEEVEKDGRNWHKDKTLKVKKNGFNNFDSTDKTDYEALNEKLFDIFLDS